ncbi:hypothetical protein Tco_0233603 [Tanacetum coccineum]
MNLKEISMNKFTALKKTTQRLERKIFTNSSLFQQAFSHLFHTDIRTFKYELSQNINNLEKKLDNEILHEKDSKSTLSVIKVQFHKFIHSEMLKSSNYDSDAREARQDFKDYTQMEAQSFKDLIIQHMESIEQCIVERARHEQEIQNSRIVSNKGNDQGLENQSNTSGDESNRSRNECNDKNTSRDDTDIRPSYDTEPMVEVPYTAEYNVFAVETQHSEQPESISNTCVVEKTDQNAKDERVALANLITNLKLDVDENKKIQKQLKKANASLTQELKECKSTLEETNRTLGESNTTRDSCLITLQSKQTELESYIALNDRTVDYEKLERKLNETLGLLAQKEIDIKEGLVKEKTKVIMDLKLKEEKDIDKMISMEKQLKFLNEIVYKRNQSIQTIHMLAPKGSTFNGRPTFANPMYLKKAQSKNPCLYEIPYDTSDLANRFVPDRKDTLTLEKESRSKLYKELVKPYDYTKQSSLYEIFKPATREYHEQLAHANKTKSVSKTNVSKGLSKPVTTQILPQTTRQAVMKPDMYRIDTRTTQTRAPQLPQTSRNTNPRMSTYTRVIHRTNVSRPQLRSTQMKDNVMPNNSQVKFRKTEVEDHHRISSISNKTKSVTTCNDSLKSRTLNVNVVCDTCGKCVFNSNHDACVSKFLNVVNARTKKPKVVHISNRQPKCQANKYVATPPKKIVASESTIQKSKSYYRMFYEKTSKA